MKEPVWIDERDVLALHDRLLALHGGAPGLRDDPLLKSALARPQEQFAYGKSDIYDLATAYTAGIGRNHPFVDGNKRTGFVAGILFLELNRYRFTASEESAARAVLSLAAGDLDEVGYSAFLRANVTREKKKCGYPSRGDPLERGGRPHPPSDEPTRGPLRAMALKCLT